MQEQEPPKEIKNEIVLSAYASLEQYKWTEQEYDDYFRAEMAIQQEIDKFEENFKEGEVKGKAAGKVEGKAEEKIETAKEMLIENEPIEKIARYTKLTIEEIKKLNI